jgi:hypothetical protein
MHAGLENELAWLIMDNKLGLVRKQANTLALSEPVWLVSQLVNSCYIYQCINQYLLIGSTQTFF